MLMLLPFIVLLPAQQWPEGLLPMPANPKDMVVIDGAKNPELIPEWSAWQHAFHSLSSASMRVLPNPVYVAVLPQKLAAVTGEILREADASKRNDDAHLEHKLKRIQRLADAREACRNENRTDQAAYECYSARARTIVSGAKEQEIEYRQRTLDIRQRLIERLLQEDPAAAAALGRWVEALKAGRTITMHRSELEGYRLPR
jgi:hypothetical protein